MLYNFFCTCKTAKDEGKLFHSCEYKRIALGDLLHRCYKVGRGWRGGRQYFKTESISPELSEVSVCDPHNKHVKV